MTFLLGILIAASVGVYIFLPYLLEWKEQPDEREIAGEDVHDHLLTQLANLEYDFRAGKVSEEDYRVLRRELEGKFSLENREAGDAEN